MENEFLEFEECARELTELEKYILDMKVIASSIKEDKNDKQ